IAICQHALAEPVRRSSQADYAQTRIDLHKVGQQRTIAALLVIIDEVTFVDYHDVHPSQHLRLGSHRLNTGKGYRLASVTATQAGAVYPERGIWPDCPHLFGVLLDQLFDVG